MIAMPALDPLDFDLPPTLQASEPPEARGLARDEVKLMVSSLDDGSVQHTQFRSLPDFLSAGDVLVINTSGTLNAALNATREDGTRMELHLSTRLPADLWIVEIRKPHAGATRPFYNARSGERLSLPAGGSVTLHRPHNVSQHGDGSDQVRLWLATLDLPYPLHDYLNAHGFPIRYNYVDAQWPIDYYQTVYANEPGSAEMPSAGRAFTLQLLTRLMARGVQVVPLVLHTGVASLEDHEPPYEEYYRVPPETARVINTANAEGRRVIAVGTTVIRALETVTDVHGKVHAGEGWTTLVIGPGRPIRATSGMLTGLHEPKATHLAMLEAFAGREHLRVTYTAALRERYLWHEFGDLHLILR